MKKRGLFLWAWGLFLFTPSVLALPGLRALSDEGAPIELRCRTLGVSESGEEAFFCRRRVTRYAPARPPGLRSRMQDLGFASRMAGLLPRTHAQALVVKILGMTKRPFRAFLR
jgi:hypothetical protein